MTIDEALREICGGIWRHQGDGDAGVWYTGGSGGDGDVKWIVIHRRCGADWVLERMEDGYEQILEVATPDYLPRLARAMDAAVVALRAVMEVQR